MPARKERVAATAPAPSQPRSPEDVLAPVQSVPIDAIVVEPNRRARQLFEGVDDLAASLEEHGLLQPIVLRPADHGTYRLVAGGRRLEAARLLRWRTIPARVLPIASEQARVIELVENLQRADLTPQEEARALEELMAERGWSVRQVAEAIKRSPSYVSKRVRVFDDPNLRDAVLEQQLPVSTAEELLTVPAPLRSVVTEAAVQGSWDAGMARAAAKALRENGEREPSAEPSQPVPLHHGVLSTRVIRSETGAEASTRPAGLTRQVKDLRETLRGVRPWDLTDGDRRELRGLFQELALLARAPAQKQQRPIIPALPA